MHNETASKLNERLEAIAKQNIEMMQRLEAKEQEKVKVKVKVKMNESKRNESLEQEVKWKIPAELPLPVRAHPNEFPPPPSVYYVPGG